MKKWEREMEISEVSISKIENTSITLNESDDVT
jgi:hypothetical protein